MPQLGIAPGEWDWMQAGGIPSQSGGLGQIFSGNPQNQALLTLGLGMLAARDRGMGFGEGTFNAYQTAANNYRGAQDQAFRNTLIKRQEDRAEAQAKLASERAKREQQDTDATNLQRRAVTAGRISTGLGGAKDPLAYWKMIQGMPEVQETLKAYGFDPAVVTPELLPQIQQQLATAAQVGGPAITPRDIELKSVIDPKTGKQVLVPESQAIGLEPGYAPPTVTPSYSVIQQPQPDGTVKPVVLDTRTGTVTDVPGTGAYKPPTQNKATGENQAAAGYLMRMGSAEKLLGSYTPSLTDFTVAPTVLTGNTLMSAGANKVMSPEGQKYYQAASDWVRAKLRKESGAVIGKEEMMAEIRTYFPVPGDSPQVIEQKAQARNVAMSAMAQAAGPALQSEVTIYPNGSPESAIADRTALETEMKRRGLIK